MSNSTGGAPSWMSKHTCTSCGAGYGICAQGAIHSLMCCAACEHPDRWTADPWTVEDLVEMWAGQEMPEWVKRKVAEMTGA